MPEPHSAAQCSLQLDQGDTYGNCEKSGTQEGRSEEGRCPQEGCCSEEGRCAQEGRSEEGCPQEGCSQARREAGRQEGCCEEACRQACPCEKGRCSSRRQDHAEPS